MRSAFAVTLSLFVLSANAAAEPADADVVRARGLFDAAAEHEAREEWEQASEKLRQALAIKETPGLRFHLAHALEKTGKLLEAEREYGRADALIRGGASAPDVEQLLGPALSSVRERIPTLSVTVPPGISFPVVSIDGSRLSDQVRGSALKLDPGEHAILVTAKGRVNYSSTLLLGDGEHRVIVAELPPEAPAKVTKGTASSPVRSRIETRGGFIGAREVVLTVELAVAVSAAGFGVYQSLQRADAEERLDAADHALVDQPLSACSNPESADLAARCDALSKSMDDVSTARDLSMVGYGVAGVAVLSAVATWFLWPSRSEVSYFRAAPLAGGGAAGDFIIRF